MRDCRGRSGVEEGDRFTVTLSGWFKVRSRNQNLIELDYEADG